MAESSAVLMPSQHQLRAELEAMVLGDLLGLAGGESEELTERTVRDRYLVGVWAPSRRGPGSVDRGPWTVEQFLGSRPPVHGP